MPAPAVYVIAVVGTVGVVFAFKEFIYPHLAPRIDRWKAEFQAAKKRRAEADGSEVALTQRSDHSDVGSSSSRPSVHPYLKNGLLIRRRSGSSETTQSNHGDVELNWISSTSTATETGSQRQDLRLRKNNVSLNEFNELNKTAASSAFLDESIQPIPYTPLSPIRTPTPTSPFPSNVFSPEVALPSKSKIDDVNSSTYPLFAPPPSSSPCAMVSASASNAESLPSSPPSLANIAAPGVAPFLPVSVDGMDSSATSLPPIIPLSSPSALALSSLPSQLVSPTWSHPSPYQTPPHVHAIPSLSQSYPLDEVLDYEHGLELLSPPSPLSRTDSPFELTGLSPRPRMVDRSTLLSAGGDQFSASPVDSTDSTRSTTYVSFSSPALSASSCIPSERGYENDFSPSEFSSTFSSPIVAPTRLGDIGSVSLSPYDQARLGFSLPLPSSGSSLPSDVNHLRRERNIGWTSTGAIISDFSSVTPRSDESDARRSIISLNDNISDDRADTQTLRTRSPSTRTGTESVATTSTSTVLESAARLSRVTTSESDFDTSSELSDLDFLSISAGEFDVSASAPAAASGSMGLGSRPVVYSGTEDGSGLLGRAGRIGGLGIEEGNESDTSSWSLAGGSE